MPMPTLSECRRLTPILRSSIKLTDDGADWLAAGLQMFAPHLSLHYEQIPDPTLAIEDDDTTICAYWECDGTPIAIRLSEECWDWSDDEYAPLQLVPGLRYYFRRWRITATGNESLILMGCVIRQHGTDVEVVVERTGMQDLPNGECLTIHVDRVLLAEDGTPWSLEGHGPMKVTLGVWGA